MRCPKCQYIGFDSGTRCRNCGYEFSLVVEEERPVEVTIARDYPGPGRLHDLALTSADAPASLEAVDARIGRFSNTSAGPRYGGSEQDLPLFTSRVVDDQAPLVTPPAVPRAPLSVRRAGPPRHRARASAVEPSLDLRPSDTHGVVPRADGDRDIPGHAAGVPQRVAAGLIDLSVLGAIAVPVVYLTLRVAQLPAADWRMLPPVPLGAFLLLLCGGYFTLFTVAGGQTIGKMLARIRVVAASVDRDHPGSIGFGTAVVRAAICFCSVVACGAGFVPVLFRDDRRAFHDQIADTRVVSA